VAADIVKSYQLCLQGDFQYISRLEEIYQNLKKRLPVAATKEKVEEIDDENEELNADDGGESMQIEKAEKTGLIVDEDGFQLVQGRRRRKSQV